MHSLFIYGTLKRGFPNFDLGMTTARFIGTFETVQAYPLIIGGKWFSPCLINEPGDGHLVTGELFEVDDQELKKLDEIEATHLPTGYRRTLVEIRNRSDKNTLEAWTYVKDRTVIEDIHSEPLNEYKIDPRYVIPANRPSRGKTPGAWK